MTSPDQLQFRLGLDAISSYKRLSYTPWHALAEFVDNSTQNFVNNHSVLEEAYQGEPDDDRLRVDITYERGEGLIRITDNAMGMDRAELDHAMIVGAKPDNTDGRSKYGLGMKTAACWLGNRWSVRTKKFGSTSELKVEVDVVAVAGGDEALPTHIAEDLDPSTHYTMLEIRDLNRPLHGQTLGKVKRYLASMYRKDLSEETLELRCQGELLTWEMPDDLFLSARDGRRYKKPFVFEIPSGDEESGSATKSVNGWIGILDRGSRAKAGFSMLHAGRVVRGWPNSWRPPIIFGQEGGSNNLLNQRLIGEVELDDFSVSHTKDDILWQGDEEQDVETKLKEEAAEYIEVANRRRKGDETDEGPSDQEVQVAVQELEGELTSGELADLITITDVPPEEVVEESLRPLLEDAETSDPDFAAQINDLEIRGYLDDLSPNDPYVAVESTQEDRILVVVNVEHPHFKRLRGVDGVLNYLRHCVYDAIAEWQARKQDGPLAPKTIKILKDRLLRVAMEIDMREPEASTSGG